MPPTTVPGCSILEHTHYLQLLTTLALGRRLVSQGCHLLAIGSAISF